MKPNTTIAIRLPVEKRDAFAERLTEDGWLNASLLIRSLIDLYISKKIVVSPPTLVVGKTK